MHISCRLSPSKQVRSADAASQGSGGHAAGATDSDEPDEARSAEKAKWSRGPAFTRHKTAAMAKASLAPLVKDLHTEIGTTQSITEGQLRAILFVMAVWHGLDLYLSPYNFEFQVFHYASFCIMHHVVSCRECHAVHSLCNCGLLTLTCVYRPWPLHLLLSFQSKFSCWVKATTRQQPRYSLRRTG